MLNSQEPTPNLLGNTLDAIVAAVPDFVYTFDLEGRFTYANLALHRLLERAQGEMVGLSFFELGYPEQLAATLQSQIQQVIDTKKTVRAETAFESAFGIGYYEYIFVPIFDDAGEVVQVAGTTRDLTERRRIEMALLESQNDSLRLVAELKAERAKLQKLFEQAPAFIATMDGPEFVFEFANADYYRLVGDREIIGKTVSDAFPEVVEQGFIELLKGVFTTGEPFVGRSMGIMITSDLGEPEQKFLDFIYQPIKDKDGTVTGILAHGVEVTDQVLAKREVERLYAELELRVKERTLALEISNKELEGFSYSVSHDLRAPLRAIVASSHVLIEDYGDQLDDRARYELERQSAAANKLAVLIDELLKLSRLARQEMLKTDVDVTALALDVAEELSGRELGKACEFEIEPGMNTVADYTSLRFLLMNLMENACKFSIGKKRVQVGKTVAGEQTVFWVQDEGVGFNMQYAEKVFLPFERLVTEKDFPGTGIGLANVKRIVERHAGKVWVETVEGEGATFFFTLGP